MIDGMKGADTSLVRNTRVSDHLSFYFDFRMCAFCMKKNFTHLLPSRKFTHGMRLRDQTFLDDLVANCEWDAWQLEFPYGGGFNNPHA